VKRPRLFFVALNKERGRSMVSRYDRDRYGQGRYDDRYENRYDRNRYFSEGLRSEYEEAGLSGYRASRAGAESWKVPGPYAGRGPRNYRRSDEAIREDVNERLTLHGSVDAGEIEVVVADSEVTLKGSVGARQERRMAEDVAGSVPGVRDVHNELEVTGQDSWARDREGRRWNTRLISGLLPTRLAVEAVIRELGKSGYSRDDITVLMSPETGRREFGIEAETRAAEGAGIGGGIGAVIGAVTAGIAAIGTTLVVPGLGLLVAGPIAAALAGAGAGGITGGLAGALIGAGIPEYQAKLYEAGMQEGGILIAVEAKSDEDADRIHGVFDDFGARRVDEDNW
jgi:osmotically-inducible protein OsmY